MQALCGDELGRGLNHFIVGFPQPGPGFPERIQVFEVAHLVGEPAGPIVVEYVHGVGAAVGVFDPVFGAQKLLAGMDEHHAPTNVLGAGGQNVAFGDIGFPRPHECVGAAQLVEHGPIVVRLVIEHRLGGGGESPVRGCPQ